MKETYEQKSERVMAETIVDGIVRDYSEEYGFVVPLSSDDYDHAVNMLVANIDDPPEAFILAALALGG